MFCQKCGKQMENDSKFCPGCGRPVTSSGYFKDEKEKPLLEIKPVFISSVTALSVLPLQIFFTIWGAGFFGGFGLIITKFLRLNLPIWFTFVFSGCVFFFGIPLLVYNAKKNAYKKTKYIFYQTKLDYYEGFFAVEEKSMSYKNVTEIYLRKGVFQKNHGLGTIVLSTPATGFQGSGRAQSGIKIVDIENPDKVYKQLKEIINRM